MKSWGGIGSAAEYFPNKDFAIFIIVPIKVRSGDLLPTPAGPIGGRGPDRERRQSDANGRLLRVEPCEFVC